MDYYDLLLAKKLGGGGGSSVTVESLSVTQNGTYTADTGKAYSPVNVNVPTGIIIDKIADGSVPDGALVLDTAISITKYAFAYRNKITSVSAPLCEHIDAYAFTNCTNVRSISFPSFTSFLNAQATFAFDGCSALEKVAFPSMTGESNGRTFNSCTSLETVDFGNAFNVSPQTFNGATAIRTLILRKSDSIVSLAAWNGITLGGIYDNPSQSTIYVPDALKSTYQSATNWVSAYNAGVTFESIEGSYYETHYGDDTVISN